MLRRQHPIWKRAVLWTLQGWLAMFYAAAGFAKLTEPASNLYVLIPWSVFANRSLVSIAGWLEILCSAGLLAPLLSQKAFTPLMRLCAMAIFIWAACFAAIHTWLLQPGPTAVNLVLAGFAATAVLMSRD